MKDTKYEYGVVFPENVLLSGLKLKLFQSKKELDLFIKELQGEVTKTNQNLTSFAYVFSKMSILPDSYAEFWKAKKSSDSNYNIGAGYYIQYETKKGRVVRKQCNFAEDFDWQLDEYKSKGYKNIVIVDLDESITADYYYQRDIEKIWGDKECIFSNW